jgi:hypothetical protein
VDGKCLLTNGKEDCILKKAIATILGLEHDQAYISLKGNRIKM